MVRVSVGLALAALAGVTPLAGQAPTAAPVPAPRLFASAGWGAGTPEIGWQLSASVSDSWGDVVVRLAEAAEFDPLATPSESTRDLAILYMRGLSGSFGWMRAGAGAGYVRVLRRGDLVECLFLLACRYRRLTTNAFGLALQADGVWVIADWFGLGLSAFGNVNDDDSFVGLTLNGHFGAMR